MERRGRGVIVNVTSIMAQQSVGYCPAYVASKGALDALTHELAALYGPKGIRVVGVAPGAIDTQLSRDLAENHSPVEKQLREFSEAMIMLGRWGTPEETGKAIAWAASDDASYVTGTTLVVDGGWMRHHLPTKLAAQLRPGQF
jgi:3-oxoacyl-[acyl-carrier protein] reductase